MKLHISSKVPEINTTGKFNILSKTAPKIKAITIGTGKFFKYAKRLQKVFMELNKIELIIIDDDIVKKYNPHNIHAIRFFIWDILFALKPDIIIYLDADIIPFKQISIPNVEFAAVKDLDCYAEQEKKKYNMNVDNYFNAGFFICNRKSIEKFNKLKALNKEEYFKYGPGADQNLLNIYFPNYYILKQEYNWLSIFGINNESFHLHFAGDKTQLESTWKRHYNSIC